MPGLPADFESRLLGSVESSLALVRGARLPEEALTDTLAAGGKRVRATLVHHFGSLAGAQAGPATELALAVEFLHAATLVHDDVIDRAETRRGRPSLHARYGDEVALLVGDLYVARCGVHLGATRSPAAAGLLWGALDVIVRGELDQRLRRFDLGQDENDYRATIRRKTGILVEAACAAAISLGDPPDAWRRAAEDYAMHLGLAFQVVDDVLDYQGDPEKMGKPSGNDIREGTVTLPLILAMRMSQAPLAAIVQSARERDDFSAVVLGVRRSGALEKCLQIASEHSELAVAELAVFPEGPDREALAALARSLVARSG